MSNASVSSGKGHDQASLVFGQDRFFRLEQHRQFFYGLMVMVATGVGIVLLSRYGLLRVILDADSSGIIWVISAMFVLCAGLMLKATYKINSEYASLKGLDAICRSEGVFGGGITEITLKPIVIILRVGKSEFSIPRDSIFGRHVENLALTFQVSPDSFNLGDLLSVKKSRLMQVMYWTAFAGTAALTLGFLGTAIGFWGALSSIGEFDPANVAVSRQLIAVMSSGVGIAISTTVVGLVLGGLELALLFRIGASACDTLISQIAETSAVFVVPFLRVKELKKKQPQTEA
jgi:biopolymer transport protein ExbB/TolQ